MLYRTLIAFAATIALGCVPIATSALAAGHGGHAMAGHAGGGHFGGGYTGGAYRGGGYRGGGLVGAGIGLGLAAGAIAGGAILGGPGPYGYSGYDPGYGYGQDDTGGGAVAYCQQRFRSYDPGSGTYLGFDGLRHPCP